MTAHDAGDSPNAYRGHVVVTNPLRTVRRMDEQLAPDPTAVRPAPGPSVRRPRRRRRHPAAGARKLATGLAVASTVGLVGVLGIQARTADTTTSGSTTTGSTETAAAADSTSAEDVAPSEIVEQATSTTTAPTTTADTSASSSSSGSASLVTGSTGSTSATTRSSAS